MRWYEQQMKANAADEFADIFGTATEADVRASVMAGVQQCEEKFQFYDKAKNYLDEHPSIRTYRAIETTFFGIFKFGSENRVLILLLMVLVSAITASSQIPSYRIYVHRPLRLDYKVYALFMAIGNGLLTFSRCIANSILC